MKVYASFREKVDVNPKDIIDGLIVKEISHRDRIFEKDGKFYRGYEQSLGSHSSEEKEEITQERYEYIKSLQLVLNHLDRQQRR